MSVVNIKKEGVVLLGPIVLDMICIERLLPDRVITVMQPVWIIISDIRKLEEK